MTVFRLCRKPYRNDLSGRGAEIKGGRWNSEGVPLLYTSQSRALSVVELAVHLPLGIHPLDYFMLTITVPDFVPVQSSEEMGLPADWKERLHSQSTREIGNQFFDMNTHLVLEVPSAVVEGDHNYLVNPRHSDFNQVTLVETVPFQFDRRLFEREI
ncbi:MAG: RES family NAD+ phosphorylase [Balneolaceae bacterium]|nr:RES family NAD+ phosphorylase [Balneolaceae bacterium]